jgi:hypothetical protein
MHRSLAALARIGHLHCTSLVWEHVDFFTDWRYTMRSAEVRLLLFSITDVLGFVRLLTTVLKNIWFSLKIFI